MSARHLALVATRRLSGFSLLEVILALAILAGAIAVLSEVSGIGMRNARLARDLTYAQLLCESKLAELVAGVEPLEAKQSVPLGTVSDSSEPDWLYSVEIHPTQQEGLLEVCVTVVKDQPPEMRPAQFSLVRWMLDPEAAASEANEPSASQETPSADSGQEANP